MDSAGRMLGDRFERQPNALNAIRLGLALTVIVWHSYSMNRHNYLPTPAERLLTQLPVDGFFAISGFLICRAWHRQPKLGRFVLARARRVLPGLWVCLLVTAFVIAPIVTSRSRGHGGFTGADQWRFVLANASTWHSVGPIGSTPTGIGWSGDWNGSLWSIGWEVGCYAAVALLGVVGLLSRRTVLITASAFWALSVGLIPTGLTALHADRVVSEAVRLPRIGLMFACGAVLWAYRDRIPVDRRLAGASVALIVAGSVLPDYRISGAPALAYLMLWLSLELGKRQQLVLVNDLSYGVYVYGFPIQVSLQLAGAPGGWLPFAVLSIAATIPVAALSWFLVEKPVLRWRQLTRPQVPDPSQTLLADGTAAAA